MTHEQTPYQTIEKPVEGPEAQLRRAQGDTNEASQTTQPLDKSVPSPLNMPRKLPTQHRKVVAPDFSFETVPQSEDEAPQSFDSQRNADKVSNALDKLTVSMKTAGFAIETPQEAKPTRTPKHKGMSRQSDQPEPQKAAEQAPASASPTKPVVESTPVDDKPYRPRHRLPKHRLAVSSGLAAAFVSDASSRAKHAMLPKHRIEELVKPKKRSGKLELSDLATVAADDTARKLSENEQQQVMAHEEQIRRGLGKLLASRGLVTLDTRNRARRPNGSLMTNKELVALAEANKLPEGFAADQFDFSNSTQSMDKLSHAQLMDNLKHATAKQLLASAPAAAEPRGIKARIKHVFNRGSAAVKIGYASTGNYLVAPKHVVVDHEDLKRQEKAGWLVVAGLGALAAGNLYLRLHGVHHGGSNAPTTASEHLASADHGGSKPQPIEHGKMLTHKPADTATLHSGENDWTVAKQQLGPNASDPQINQVDHAIMHMNHQTEASARQQAVGTKLKLPTKLIANIRKQIR
jgi:hypothetical protein